MRAHIESTTLRSITPAFAMTPAANAPVLLTVREAAAALSISRSMVYQLLARGELASVLIGRCRRVPTGALDDYVERLRAEQEPPWVQRS